MTNQQSLWLTSQPPPSAAQQNVHRTVIEEELASLTKQCEEVKEVEELYKESHKLEEQMQGLVQVRDKY